MVATGGGGGTQVVANLHVTLPGSFARERDLQVPREEMLKVLEAAAGGAKRVYKCDLRALAVALAGDAVFANLLCLGVAYQKGLIPVPDWCDLLLISLLLLLLLL